MVAYSEGVVHVVGLKYAKQHGILLKADAFLSLEQFRAVAAALAEIASNRGKHAEIFRSEQEIVIHCRPQKRTEDPDDGIPLDELHDKTIGGGL